MMLPNNADSTLMVMTRCRRGSFRFVINLRLLAHVKRTSSSTYSNTTLLQKFNNSSTIHTPEYILHVNKCKICPSESSAMEGSSAEGKGGRHTHTPPPWNRAVSLVGFGWAVRSFATVRDDCAEIGYWYPVGPAVGWLVGWVDCTHALKDQCVRFFRVFGASKRGTAVGCSLTHSLTHRQLAKRC